MEVVHTGAHSRDEGFSLSMQRMAALVGRMGLSLIFLVNAAGKIADFEGMQTFMGSKDMPAAGPLLILAMLVELSGGLALLLGWKTRWFSLLLALYLIPTTFIFHNFWAFSGAEQQMQLMNFLKNCAIIGGLLMLVAGGAGGYSLDHATEHKR